MLLDGTDLAILAPQGGFEVAKEYFSYKHKNTALRYGGVKSIKTDKK